jgi:hypothetical protein
MRILVKVKLLEIPICVEEHQLVMLLQVAVEITGPYKM